MSKIQLLIFFSSVVLSAFSAPEAIFEFSNIVSESDLIALVKVTDVVKSKEKDNNEIDENIILTSCQVLEIYESNHKSEKHIEISSIDPVDHIVDISLPQEEGYAIVFLKYRDNSRYSFTEIRHPQIPIFNRNAKLPTKNKNLIEIIKEKLTANITIMTSDYRSSSLEWLNTLDLIMPDRALNAMLQSEDKNIQFDALFLKVKYGDKASANKVIDILHNSNDISSNPRLKSTLWELDRSQNLVSVKQANELAASSDQEISRVGLRILANKADFTSARILISGLEHRTKDGAYAAVRGLHLINNSGGPSFREFLEDPDSEIARWKAWWLKQNK